MKAEEIAEKEYPILKVSGNLEYMKIIAQNAKQLLKRKGFVKGYNYDKWIRIKDEFPIDGSYVIGYNRELGVREVRFHNVSHTITHWQPLPEIPTEL